MKHKSEDYKVSAVKYYLKYEVSMHDVCEIYGCSKTSLKRWIDKYEKDGSIKRHKRKPVSYKVTKSQVEYALKLLKQNEQITLSELATQMKKKYKIGLYNLIDIGESIDNLTQQSEPPDDISKEKPGNCVKKDDKVSDTN